MEDYAIEIDHVTIRFNMASEKVDNLKEYIIKLIKKELIFQEFLAVKDVSFKVKRGEAWALIGVNGSGKSTFINTFAGRACAKTGNKPGVTKGKQWIRLNKGVELLDTPGILWPKFEDQQVGIRLACVGSIKDDILNMEELALWLIDYLRENYKGILAERYQITEEGTSVEVLEAIARARGCLKKQEELDYAKASLILFDDFRSGKMGRITLEWAPL